MVYLLLLGISLCTRIRGSGDIIWSVYDCRHSSNGRPTNVALTRHSYPGILITVNNKLK